MDDYIEFNDDISKYEEDDGFDNYQQTTIDPGDSLFIFTAIFCITSIIALPFLVELGNRRAKKRHARKNRERACNSNNIETEHTVHEQINDTIDDFNGTHADANELSDPDDLSIFSQIEKEYLDDMLSQGDASNSMNIMSDILQTPFCCVGPDMKNDDELHPVPSLSHEVSDEVAFRSVESSASTPSRPFPFLRKNQSNSSTDDPTKKKRMNKRQKLKKALKAMAKSQPMIRANINVKAPKTTLLDGGFFGQRKHRNHGTITEKQIMREENRDANDLCCNCLDDPCCVGIEIDNENEDDCTSVDSASVKEKSSERPASYPTRDISYCGAFTSDARTIIKIFRIDREFRRILSLMLPFTVTSILSKIFEFIDIALISWRLGTESLAAYAVSNYIVELVLRDLILCV